MSRIPPQGATMLGQWSSQRPQPVRRSRGGLRQGLRRLTRLSRLGRQVDADAVEKPTATTSLTSTTTTATPKAGGQPA